MLKSVVSFNVYSPFTAFKPPDCQSAQFEYLTGLKVWSNLDGACQWDAGNIRVVGRSVSSKSKNLCAHFDSGHAAGVRGK